MNDLSHARTDTPTEHSPRSAALPEDFSLVLGGPLYQFYLRFQLARPTMDLLHRREIAVMVITWVPLLVLTALGDNLLAGVQVLFFFDIDAHARFLLALPLLIGAELIVHRRVRGIVEQFRERGIVAPEVDEAFDRIIGSVMQLRNSVLVEVSLLLLAFVGGYWFWSAHMTLNVATWYARLEDGGMRLTWAGRWFAFVSLPIGRFLLLRWYFRFLLWYIFLWRVSRLPLRLNPLHPDCSGGLGFINSSVDAFAPVLVGQTVFLAGFIASQIFHAGATLPQFKLDILGYLVTLMLVVVTPLSFFAFPLAQAKRVLMRQFGRLAGQYADAFRSKWLTPASGALPNESLLGSADLQSLADLASAYDTARGMRMIPISKAMLLRLAIILVIPLFPLTLTMIPLEELVDRVLRSIL